MTWMNRASGYTPNSDDYILINRLGHYYKPSITSTRIRVGISGICQHMIDGGFPADRVFPFPTLPMNATLNPCPVTASTRPRIAR